MDRDLAQPLAFLTGDEGDHTAAVLWRAQTEWLQQTAAGSADLM